MRAVTVYRVDFGWKTKDPIGAVLEKRKTERTCIRMLRRSRPFFRSMASNRRTNTGPGIRQTAIRFSDESRYRGLAGRITVLETEVVSKVGISWNRITVGGDDKCSGS